MSHPHSLPCDTFNYHHYLSKIQGLLNYLSLLRDTHLFINFGVNFGQWITNSLTNAAAASA